MGKHKIICMIFIRLQHSRGNVKQIKEGITCSMRKRIKQSTNGEVVRFSLTLSLRTQFLSITHPNLYADELVRRPIAVVAQAWSKKETRLPIRGRGLHLLSLSPVNISSVL